jgi:TonB family protein
MSAHAATLSLPTSTDRELGLALPIALVLHAGVAWWGAQLLPRVRPLHDFDRPQMVHTVQQDVVLPKPLPPVVPPPPKPELAPAKTETETAKAPAPRARSVTQRAPQPATQKPTAAPEPGPQPFALSQTYDGPGAGVAVQKAEEDVFGDPDVDVTAANVRRRPSEVPKPEAPAEPAPLERAVEIQPAKPKAACRHVEWPEGAEVGNRVIEVVLGLEIGLDGTVAKVRVLRSGGEPFDDAAVEHVRGCGWEAGRRDGKPFVDHVSFAVEFRPTGG